MEINFKKRCLAINPNLKASKVRGTEFYHITEGQKLFSACKNSIKEAWEDCYNSGVSLNK